MNDWEKMDAIKQRLNVTYAQAKEALDMCGGDLAAALAYLDGSGQEEQGGQAASSKWDKETTENFVRGLIEQIKSIIQEGNVSKVRLKKGQQTIIEVPATLGVVGLGMTLFSPLLLAIGAVGAATAFIKELTFELERPDGTIESRTLKFKHSYFKDASSKEDDSETYETEITPEADAEEDPNQEQ